MYYDDQGRFKGEALVMYFKEGSVDLAITLLDDTELELGAGFGNMRVRVAEYDKSQSSNGGNKDQNNGDNGQGEKRKVDAVESGASSGSGSGTGTGTRDGGDANDGPSGKEKKKLAFEEKAKMSKRIKTMQKWVDSIVRRGGSIPLPILSENRLVASLRRLTYMA